MNKFKCVFLVISAMLICSLASAQVKDSLPVKTSVFSKLNFSKLQLPKVHMPKLNFFKKDSSVKAVKLTKDSVVEKPKLNFSKLRLPKFNLFKKDSTIVKSNEIPAVAVNTALDSKRNVPEVEKVAKVSVPVIYSIPKSPETTKTPITVVASDDDKPIFEKKAAEAKPNTDSLLKKQSATTIESPLVGKVIDTTKKKSWLSKLTAPKKAAVIKDSAMFVAPVIVKAKDTVALVPVVVKVNDTIASAPLVEKVIDTTKKKSWLSKLTAPKKAAVIKDSAMFVAPVIVKAKDTVALVPVVVKVNDTIASAPLVEKVIDTTKKKSWLSKLTAPKKAAVIKDSAMFVAPVIVKAKDTVALVPVVVKVNDTVAFKVKNTATVKVKDTIAKKVKVKEATIAKVKDTTSIYKTVEQRFLKYTATTTVSLLGGANFSKQTIDANGFNSNFNYTYSDINEDVYKTGYFGGIRLDGFMKKKHEYSLSFSIGKVSSGANYVSSTSLRPVVGSFSTFKAEDHFFVMNLAAHYKKLIPYGDLEKFKFYIVGGPSLDARLSKSSLDNQVTNAYKQIFIKGDLGVEFNNRSLYTLFLHYQHNIGSLTKSPIKTNINTFQFGILVKAADLL